MRIELAVSENIPVILEIINQAQKFLASQNIEQWQNGYPNLEAIEADINNKESYVVLSDNNEVMATTMFTTNPESTYVDIIGEWLTNSEYGVIHRLAISDDYRNKGLAKSIFNHFENELRRVKIGSLKVDTHSKNKAMQHLLSQTGYTYCGIIYLEDGDKRLAFEKVLEIS